MKKRALALMLLLGLLLASPAWATAEVFTEHAINADFDGAISVYATDLDGDGDVDVLGAAVNSDDITWWENDGSEVFAEHTIKGNFDEARSVYATDVDGDGDVDVLGTASGDDDITWWENDGTPADGGWTEHTIKGDFDGAYSVYATDVDGDGDVDVLGAAVIGGDITWWENDGSEVFTEHTIKGDFAGAVSVYATDVDGDGDVDVLGAATIASDITWWENDGSEVFTEHTIEGDFYGAYSVYATDVDGDGDVDVLGAAESANDITWWENDGSETFTEHTIKGDFTGATSVYAKDVDGDGDVDVLGAAYYADDITWWENDGGTPPGFTEHTIKGDFDGAYSVYATDLDGDGDVDVLGAAWDASDITWWQNLGLANGSFELGPRIPVPWKGQKLTLKDKRVCTTHYDGSCSFLFIGNTANKSLKQVVNISGDAGDSFTLSGRSKAKSPSASGGAYCLEAKVFHTDATKKTYKACFTKSTHGWQYREKAFTTVKDYNKIEVYLRYANQAGKAWFDDVLLVVH